MHKGLVIAGAGLVSAGLLLPVYEVNNFQGTPPFPNLGGQGGTAWFSIAGIYASGNSDVLTLYNGSDYDSGIPRLLPFVLVGLGVVLMVYGLTRKG